MALLEGETFEFVFRTVLRTNQPPEFRSPADVQLCWRRYVDSVFPVAVTESGFSLRQEHGDLRRANATLIFAISSARSTFPTNNRPMIQSPALVAGFKEIYLHSPS